MPPAPLPADESPPLPRGQVRTACAVVGCLGLVVAAAIAALIYIVLRILGEVAPPPANTDKARKPTASHRPAPVSPTLLKTERATIPLDSPFDAVGRAANGRFLLLRFPAKAEIAIFDPVEAKVVQRVSVEEKNALFAGSASKLFVYKPKAKELIQFDLVSGAKEDTAKKPDSMSNVELLSVGHAADGPVFAVAGSTPTEVAIIDPASASWNLLNSRAWGAIDPSRPIRPTADGLGLCLSAADASSAGRLVRFSPPRSFSPVGLGNDRMGVGHVAPSPDGRFLYTARGVFSSNGFQTLRPDGEFFYTLPTAHGSDLFLSLETDDTARLSTPVRLHAAGSRIALATVPNVTLPTGISATDAAEIPIDQRLHLWPACGLLAVLPSSNNAIELQKVDVQALLMKSNRDLLVFGSEPPLSVSRGATYTYEPAIWSLPAGNVALEVTGPPEMSVSGKQVVWPVPASGDEREVSVKVRARHSDGRTAEQAFRVVVVDTP